MCKSKYNLILFVAGMFFVTTGCSTTKKFAVQSNPSGALITIHQTEEINSANVSGGFPANPNRNDVTPFEKKVAFLKDETYYIGAEKRGYKPAMQAITKDSGPEVNLQLERIEGAIAEAEVFDKNKLKNSSFSFLPVDVEVLIHSGVGRMDKNTYSAELSQQTAQKLSEELKKAYADKNIPENQSVLLNPALETDWMNSMDAAKKYLSGLNPVRLPYYSYPPLLASGVTKSQTFFEHVKQISEKPGNYLYYIHAKCISETTGRKVGNFFLGLAGATVHAHGISVGTYFYFDPSAFNPDSGTLLTIYVLDAITSEVLLIEQSYLGYDITKYEDLLKLVKKIIEFAKAGPLK